MSFLKFSLDANVQTPSIKSRSPKAKVQGQNYSEGRTIPGAEQIWGSNYIEGRTTPRAELRGLILFRGPNYSEGRTILRIELFWGPSFEVTTQVLPIFTFTHSRLIWINISHNSPPGLIFDRFPSPNPFTTVWLGCQRKSTDLDIWGNQTLLGFGSLARSFRVLSKISWQSLWGPN